MNQQAVKFAPAELGEKRIELSMEGGQTVIRLSNWVDGLGWCGEKTMSLNEDLIDDLHAMLGAARLRIKNRKADENSPASDQNNVLNFPVIS